MSPVFIGSANSTNKLLGNLSSNPSSGNAEGDQYYNTADNDIKVYDGSEWKQLQLVGNLGADASNPASSAAALSLKPEDNLVIACDNSLSCVVTAAASR